MTAVVSAAIVIAEAATGDIDIIAIVEDIGEIAESLAYGECVPPTVVEILEA